LQYPVTSKKPFSNALSPILRENALPISGKNRPAHIAKRTDTKTAMIQNEISRTRFALREFFLAIFVFLPRTCAIVAP
jgi:hypothetical protein